MNDSTDPNRGRPAGGPPDSSRYELWFDGLLDDAEARRELARVAREPEARARFEADRAIEASLRRSFGAKPAARTWPVGPADALPRSSAGVRRVAAAAGVLALFAAALALALREDGDKGRGNPPLASAGGTFEGVRGAPGRGSMQCSMGDVFLDALAVDFQPLLGCRIADPWDADLFAQLSAEACGRDEEVVVLGEWLDPRVSAANVVLLRRGENPIMLVVSNCEQEPELCVPKDSGLYVHRGVREGRAIYEISPLPGSEVLQCVDAQNVVTQQQL